MYIMKLIFYQRWYSNTFRKLICKSNSLNI